MITERYTATPVGPASPWLTLGTSAERGGPAPAVARRCATPIRISVHGTRVPCATPGADLFRGDVTVTAVKDATFVGSKAWSPPV